MKKVEQREKAKKEEANGQTGQTDVASILARRVAVEMSDSDNENASDGSEYDSDEWGDESTAWRRSKSLKKEYFFKSQESLATVIDNDEEEEEVEINVDAENNQDSLVNKPEEAKLPDDSIQDSTTLPDASKTLPDTIQTASTKTTNVWLNLISLPFFVSCFAFLVTTKNNFKLQRCWKPLNISSLKENLH